MQSYYTFKNTNKIDNDLISLNNLMWGILKNEFVKSKKYVLMLKLTKKFIWIEAITHAFKKKKKERLTMAWYRFRFPSFHTQT